MIADLPGHCKRYRPRVDGLAPPTQGTAGGDVSANKRTSERNDAKPVISANTGAQGHILGLKYRH